MNLSIEVTEDQHPKMKAMAAIQGKSLNQYILDTVLPKIDERESRQNPIEFLKVRADEADQGKFSNKSVDEILEKYCRKNLVGKCLNVLFLAFLNFMHMRVDHISCASAHVDKSS